jgi:unsaturated rhamnogalacturonyl hydrolase
VKAIGMFVDTYLQHYVSYKGELAWNYEDGCVLIGAQRLYEATNDKKYYDFVYSYMDKRIDSEGNIAKFSYTEYNIDNVNSGKVLFLLLKVSNEERFKKALDKVYYQLRIQPRTKDGNFWHKSRYPYQVWLDGLYMAQPFYTQYETEFNNKANYVDIYNQFCNVRRLLFNEDKGLYYHGYDETRTMNWADKKTGVSPNFWARAVGWYTMALIDTLEVMSDQIFEYHRELQKIFKEIIKSIVKYQDSNSSMWYQVLAKEGESGNYLETSASLMFAYSIFKGVRLGFVSEDYLDYGKNAFEGTVKKFLVEKDGKTSLGGICIMAGLNGVVTFNGNRDGSYEYYLSEAVGSDDPKGTGPLMMAFSEMLRLK